MFIKGYAKAFRALSIKLGLVVSLSGPSKVVILNRCVTFINLLIVDGPFRRYSTARDRICCFGIKTPGGKHTQSPISTQPRIMVTWGLANE